MSARASWYAKSLVVCPNGERVSRGEKLVLIVLADNHQDKAGRGTYPSIETIAEDALCDRRSCQRHLAALERKGVIRRLRPANQGSGMTTFYFFTALDEIPDASGEGWQNAALFFTAKGGRRAAEGRQKGDKTRTPSIKNTNRELELKTPPPTPAPAGESGETKNDAALKEPAGDAGNPEKPAELDAAQRAVVERHRSGGREEMARQFEAYYREENAKAAREAREREERAQAAAAESIRLRALMPTREAAVAWVVDECGFSASRRGRGIERDIGAVLDQEARRGVPVWETAPQMAAAWKQHRDHRSPGFAPYGPANLFRLGLWRVYAGSG